LKQPAQLLQQTLKVSDERLVLSQRELLLRNQLATPP